MAPPTPAALGRKIMIEGEALKAVERRADADQTSWKQAASELILGTQTASLEASPAKLPTLAGALSEATVSDLLEELRARFNLAASKRDLEDDLTAAVARAELAEGKLADMKALLA